MTRESGPTVAQGTFGRWWSQGANSNTDARYLGINGNYTGPESNYYKTNGFSVRCVGSTRVNDILHQFPFSLPISGIVRRENGETALGTYGRFWAADSTSTDNTAMALLYYNNQLGPNDANLKTGGSSVRCTAKWPRLHPRQ